MMLKVQQRLSKHPMKNMNMSLGFLIIFEQFFASNYVSKTFNEVALCAGNEHVVQNEEFPKNIEVIIGKLDHCAYAGIYEREPVMFNMIYNDIIIDFMMKILNLSKITWVLSQSVLKGLNNACP